MALRADEVVMPGGRAARREIIEHPGAVAIAALDPDDRLMMVHQYRHAAGPGGSGSCPPACSTSRGRTPSRPPAASCARRRASRRRSGRCCVDVAPSPGFSDESVRVYLARGLTEVDRPELGDDEEADLTTRWVTLSVAVRMVLAGTIVNGVTAAAVLAANAVAGSPAALRPPDAPWPDRPTRFAAR